MNNSVVSDHPLRACAEYFMSGMDGVQGFLHHGAASTVLTLLEAQRRAGITGTVAEIGVYHGKMFVGMALSRKPGERALACDVFGDGENDFFGTFSENCRKHSVYGETVQVLRANSQKVTVHQWRDLVAPSLRFIHVDGEHTKKGLLHDLLLAHAGLGPGGIIVVDDVFHPWYPELTEAVIDFLRAHPDLQALALTDRHGPIREGAAKLVLCQTEHYALYRGALIEGNGKNISQLVPFCGSSMLTLEFDHGIWKEPLAFPPGAA